MSKYDEIMHKIVVTPEMKHRILSNIEASDFKKTRPLVRFRSYRKYLSIAACFVLLIVSAAAIPKLLKQGEMDEPSDILQSNDIMNVDTIDELSEAVGFPVDNITALPFEATEIAYTAYGDGLASVSYRNGEQTLIYRKSSGQEDNSGDYNTYESELQINIRNTAVTIKGNHGKYNLAVWNNSRYSYSVFVSDGISKEELIKLVGEINW